MKYKVLILQEDLFTDPSANTKLVFRLCEQLEVVGYDVSVLGIARNENEHITAYRGIHLVHEPADNVKLYEQLIERLGKNKIMRYFLWPRSVWYRINYKSYTPFYLEVRRWLPKHINEYDVLIACCSPYYTLALASEVANKIPVIYYKIDPVSTIRQDNKNRDARMVSIANEIKWDNAASRIVMQEVVYRDFMRLPTKVNGHKAVVVQFPNVRKIVPLQHPSKIVEQFDKAKINLLFVGKFYADIRHPQYLFNLMEPLRDTNIVLHIFGDMRYMGFDKEYIEKYFTNKIPNIRFHGVVPPEEADDLLLHADVLVHVGNAVDSLMPSKILDYISSGKPILNICKIRTCPTLPLMERYPLGMTIYEPSAISGQQSVISDQVVEQVKQFCIENKRKQVPYEQIEKIYPECTIEYVGQQFDETIQIAINEFSKTKI